MTPTPMTEQQLTTDRTLAIVFMSLGVLLEIIWFVPSLMTVMSAANGSTLAQQVGIPLVILGPIVAVVALLVTTIVLLARKRRAMIAGILTFVAPIVVIVLGMALVFTGF